MQTMKRLLAALLVGTLLIFSGCNVTPPQDGSASGTASTPGATGTNTSTKTKGRFVETDVTPQGEDLLGIVKLSDGTLSIFSKGMHVRYDSTDNGVTWEKSEGPGAKNPELEHVYSMIAVQDDTLLVTLMDQTGNSGSIKKISRDGTVEDFSVPEFDKLCETGNFTVNQLVRLGNSQFFLNGYRYGDIGSAGTESSEEGSAEEAQGTQIAGGDMKELSAVFDAQTGEKLYDVPNANIFSAAGSNEKFYLVDYNDQLTTRVAADGKEAKSVSMHASESAAAKEGMTATSFTMRALSALPDGTLFSLTSKALDQINPENGETETLMKGTGFSFGSANNYISQFFALDSQTFFVALMGMDDATHIYRYTYDENAAIDPNKSLNIWALQDNATVRAAITEFMKKNPDATLNFEAALSENSAQSANDAIQALNTKILAGNGPDIIVLDGLPVERYIQNGMLSELTGKLDLSDAYPEMIDPLKTDGKLFYLPARVKVSLLTAETETLAAMTTMDSVVSAVTGGNDRPVMAAEQDDPFAALSKEQRPVFGFTDLEEVFPYFWNSSVNEIVRDGAISEAQLQKLLEALKAVSDKYKLTDEQEMSSGGMVMIFGDSEGEVISDNILSYMNNRALAGLYGMGNFVYLQMCQAEDAAYSIFPGLSQGSYQPGAMTGINAKSNAQEFAAEFIQSLLSTESQSAMGGGFPVTKAGFQAQMAALETLKISDATGVNETEPFVFDMDNFVKTMKTPVLTDEFLTSTVLEAATAYCKGELDLNAAVGKIQSETKNYLAERA